MLHDVTAAAAAAVWTKRSEGDYVKESNLARFWPLRHLFIWTRLAASSHVHYTTLHYTMVHDVVSSSHQIRLTSFSSSSYSLSLTRDCCCCDVRTAAVCCSMEQGERIYLSSLSSLSSLCSLSDAALLWEWSCQLLLLLFVHTCPLPPSAMIIVVVFLWRVNPFRPIDSDRLIALSLHPSAVVITPRARCTTVRCCCSCCW